MKRKLSQVQASNENDSGDKFVVIIIGGGIAGLSSALAIQNSSVSSRVNVFVLERDAEFGSRKQGYGMTITNNPKGPLAKLGLLDNCQRFDCPSYCHYVFDQGGSVLGYYGREFQLFDSKKSNLGSHSSNSRGNLRIPRQDLCKMMIEKLCDDTVVWGCKFMDYSDSRDSVIINIEIEKSIVDTMKKNNHKLLEFCKEEPCDSSVVRLRVTANLLIGSDGMRSLIRSQRDDQLHKSILKSIAKKDSESQVSIPAPLTPLRYLGVCVIIGLSTYEHPLLDHRGFYALNGSHRLFTMPFRDAGVDATGRSNDQMVSKWTMWQLSFSLDDDEKIHSIKNMQSTELLNEALSRVDGWFHPISELIRNTFLEEIWGSALHDRDPMVLCQRHDCPRVLLVGDACHPMSMFKGQGANQALEDGPLIGQLLEKAGVLDDKEKLFTQVKIAEREIVARSASKVLASRQAAKSYHSKESLDEEYGIEGWKDIESFFQDRHIKVVNLLKERGANATLGKELDSFLKKCQLDFQNEISLCNHCDDSECQ